MSKRFVGKPSPMRLEKLLSGSYGKSSSKLLVGPGPGLDAAVLDIGNDQVMAIAEDPIFPAPKLPLEIMGQFTVHIGASDVAVTGITPQFLTYTLLLPGTSPESDARQLIQSISESAETLGITIVGGHTGWYDVVNVPIVGGVTVWGLAPKDQWVSPGGAQSGDVILMTKGPSIEAAALLAVLYRDKLKGKLNTPILNKLNSRIDEITVVKDALTAFHAGGVHAMHDATEGGVLGGLWEMVASSNIPIRTNLDRITVPEDIQILAEALNFNPWKAISEGTLLAAVDPQCVQQVTDAWDKVGIEHYTLGTFDNTLSKNILIQNNREQELPEPDIDPFWDLFFAGLA